jgi:hypothetical protein
MQLILILLRCAALSIITGAALYLESPLTVDKPRAPMHLTTPSTPIPASYFGIHVHHPSPESWPQIPATEWRLWDSAGTVWYDLEPRQGQWDFSQLDRDVAMAEEHHVGLLLTLGQSPPWASSRPKDPPAWRLGGPAPPTSEEDWKSYVRRVAVRYQGRIHAYEVWNEANLTEFYTGTPEQLVALARDAYGIIHNVDPQALVVSPAITGAYGVSWFRHYLELGGGQYADVIGYHFYASPEPPEASIATILHVREAMRTYGLENKPLWNTETGYSITSNFGAVNPATGSLSRVVSQPEALGYVMRDYLVNWASGVSRLYWYDWDGNGMGLGDNQGKQKKIPAYGYAIISQWLVGATMKRCDRDNDGTWICELTRDHRTEWIVWNEERAGTVTLSASWQVTEIDSMSQSGSITGQKLRPGADISYSPLPSLIR